MVYLLILGAAPDVLLFAAPGRSGPFVLWPIGYRAGKCGSCGEHVKKSSKFSKRPLSRSPQAPGRSADIKDAFQQNYPMVQYHFVQFLSEHLVDCLRTFGGDFEQVIILAVLGQSHLNTLLAPEESRAKGPLSASRIADVTGLPRETVRRKLSLLGARGWLSQNAAHEWVLVGPSDRTVAGRGLTKLDSRGLARLARLHAMLEPLTKPPKMGT